MSTTSQGQPQRAYHSPRRLAAARETRARIRAAAARLFLADGYAATSIRAIATSAGVAEKTVYLQFATKTALLKEVVETAIVGDDHSVAAAERQWFRDIIEAPDPDQKIRLLVDATAALHERTGALFAMVLLAAGLESAGMLPAGRDTDWATAVLYVLVGPETWHLARVELGQDPPGYRDWLRDTLTDTFDVTPSRTIET